MDPAAKAVKKQYQYILLIIIAVVTALIVAGSISKLTATIYSPTVDKEIFSIIARFVLFVGLIWLIGKLKLSRFNSISSVNISELPLLVFPLLIISFGLASNWELYQNSEQHLIIIFAISVISIGIIEELICRGVFLPLIIRGKMDKDYSLVIGLVYSSILFGLLHYINLLNGNAGFWDVTSQVLFGFCIGMYLGALFLRTGNILIPILIHALFNFTFGTGMLRQQTPEITVVDTSFLSFLPTLLVFALIAYSGFHMLKRVDKEQVMEKVCQIQI